MYLSYGGGGGHLPFPPKIMVFDHLLAYGLCSGAKLHLNYILTDNLWDKVPEIPFFMPIIKK